MRVRKTVEISFWVLSRPVAAAWKKNRHFFPVLEVQGFRLPDIGVKFIYAS
jgi:hypothetical protein